MSFNGYDMPGHALMDASHAASRWGAKADGNTRGGNPSIQGATVTVNGVRISPRAGMLRPEQVPPVMVAPAPATSSTPSVVALPIAVASPPPPTYRAPQHDSASAYQSLRDQALSAIRGEPMAKGEGEGSRGGKVIGHTKSGKPIYDDHGHAGHADFSSTEHRQARDAHDPHIAAARERGDSATSDAAKHAAYAEAQRHIEASWGHERARDRLVHGTNSMNMEKGVGGVGFHEEPVHLRRIGMTKSGRVAWLAKSPGDLAYDGCTRDDHMQISDLHWQASEKATAALRECAMAKNAKASEHQLTLYAHHRRLAYDHIVAAENAAETGNARAAALL